MSTLRAFACISWIVLPWTFVYSFGQSAQRGEGGPQALAIEEISGNSTARAVESPESTSVVGSVTSVSSTSRRTRQTNNQRPFTVAAVTGGASTLGGQFQIVTNLSRQMELRTNLNYIEWFKGITIGEFTAPAAHAYMASSDTSLDLYPFARHGLRVSPGLLIHNGLTGDAFFALASPQGGPFKINGHTYYSAPDIPNRDPFANAPQYAWADEGLHLRNAAFTMTTGWGDMLPRRKSRTWSFPVEIGIGFLGSPTVSTRQIGGMVCNAQGLNCVDTTTVPQLRSDIQTQFGAYKSRLDMLKTFPIISFGVAYSGHPKADSY